jgi:hypothetical protein
LNAAHLQHSTEADGGQGGQPTGELLPNTHV